MAHGLPRDTATLKTFRSRVRNFQKLGLVPSAPGKGQKVSYTLEDAIAWAMCFQLAEAGLAPNIIKSLMDRYFALWVRNFEGPSHLGNDDTYLCIAGNFLKWHTEGEAHGPSSMRTQPASGLVLNVLMEPGYSRTILINLTRMKRDLGKALEIDWA